MIVVIRSSFFRLTNFRQHKKCQWIFDRKIVFCPVIFSFVCRLLATIVLKKLQPACPGTPADKPHKYGTCSIFPLKYFVSGVTAFHIAA
jgi:hypothetical protein